MISCYSGGTTPRVSTHRTRFRIGKVAFRDWRRTFRKDLPARCISPDPPAPALDSFTRPSAATKVNYFRMRHADRPVLPAENGSAVKLLLAFRDCFRSRWRAVLEDSPRTKIARLGGWLQQRTRTFISKCQHHRTGFVAIHDGTVHSKDNLSRHCSEASVRLTVSLNNLRPPLNPWSTDPSHAVVWLSCWCVYVLSVVPLTLDMTQRPCLVLLTYTFFFVTPGRVILSAL